MKDIILETSSASLTTRNGKFFLTEQRPKRRREVSLKESVQLFLKMSSEGDDHFGSWDEEARAKWLKKIERDL